MRTSGKYQVDITWYTTRALHNYLIPHHGIYNGQHNQCRMCAAHDGKVALLHESKKSRAVNKVTLLRDGTTDGTRQAVGWGMQYKSSCFRCGENHSAQTCWFEELKYFYCKQKGHINNRCPNFTWSQSRGERQGPLPHRSNQRGYRGQQQSGNLLQKMLVIFVRKRLGGGCVW